jgi:hypothetical protein
VVDLLPPTLGRIYVRGGLQPGAADTTAARAAKRTIVAETMMSEVCFGEGRPRNKGFFRLGEAKRPVSERERQDRRCYARQAE